MKGGRADESSDYKFLNSPRPGPPAYFGMRVYDVKDFIRKCSENG